jgi:hypothetical protein
MRPTILCSGFAAMLALFSEASIAHHAFSPVYDGSRTITIEGVVAEFRLINPHSLMTLDVTDEQGNSATWTVEFAGKLHLTVSGWTDDTIRAGERITVHGNPSHSGSSKLFFQRIVKADGTELVSARREGFESIDELRRRRARERDQQN